jgi:hypothetical protein
MFADYLIYIGFRFRAIPYIIRIYYYARPEFATIKATGIIHAGFFDAQRFYAGFHIVAQFLGVLFGAATARVAGLTPVGAAEDMVREKTHCFFLITKDTFYEKILQEGDDKDHDYRRNVEPAEVGHHALYRL